MKLLRRSLVVLAASSVALVARAAIAAEVPAKSDLLRLVEDGGAAFNAFLAGEAAASPPPLRATRSSEGSAPPSADFAPRGSILLRDWRGSFRLAGAPTNVIDDVRPSASNRMVIARLEGGARLSPFAQMGIGEWRIDPALFPAFPTYNATCGQVGAGFQLAAMKHLSVAAEGQYTFLYGAQPWAGDVPVPRLLAGLIAVHATF
jgi:hypothetical protein